MTDQGETWVWADGTIYDPSIPGYRQATADELRRNVTIESGCDGCAALKAELDALRAAAKAIVARYGRHCPPGSWQSPGHDVIFAEWDALDAALSHPSRPSAQDPEPGPNPSPQDTSGSARRPGGKVVERRPR